MNLYHYCSNATFLSIVSTRTVWASGLSLSNDAMEGRWIRNIFSDYCDERKLHPNEREQLLSTLDTLTRILIFGGFCMSAKADLLSQWRGYADNGAGVCIGFSKDYLADLGDWNYKSGGVHAHLAQVIYEPDQQKALIATDAEELFTLIAKGALRTPSLLSMETPTEEEERKANYMRLSTRLLTLFPHIYKLKNPAFREEEEWRLISMMLVSSDTENKGPKSSGIYVHEAEFRATSDRIVPYRAIPLEQLSRTAINEVIVGPRNLTPDVVVEAGLLRHGWQGTQVRRSSASYR